MNFPNKFRASACSKFSDFKELCDGIAVNGVDIGLVRSTLKHREHDCWRLKRSISCLSTLKSRISLCKQRIAEGKFFLSIFLLFD